MNEKILEEIMNTTCKDEQGKRKLKKYLVKLKPLKKYEKTEEAEIPTEVLEKLVHKLISKYMVDIQNINITVCPADNVSYYSSSLIDRRNYRWLGSVHARTINEVMAKIALRLFFRIKLDEIPTREEWDRSGSIRCEKVEE